jgi:hypothetical protein
VEVISGLKKRQLGVLQADAFDQRILLVDIGGGSTKCSSVARRDVGGPRWLGGAPEIASSSAARPRPSVDGAGHTCAHLATFNQRSKGSVSRLPHRIMGTAGTWLMIRAAMTLHHT